MSDIDKLLAAMFQIDQQPTEREGDIYRLALAVNAERIARARHFTRGEPLARVVTTTDALCDLAEELTAKYGGREAGNHHPDCNYWKWDWRYSWAPSDCTCAVVGAAEGRGDE